MPPPQRSTHGGTARARPGAVAFSAQQHHTAGCLVRTLTRPVARPHIGMSARWLAPQDQARLPARCESAGGRAIPQPDGRRSARAHFDAHRRYVEPGRNPHARARGGIHLLDSRKPRQIHSVLQPEEPVRAIQRKGEVRSARCPTFRSPGECQETSRSLPHLPSARSISGDNLSAVPFSHRIPGVKGPDQE
jgi:hypothetical protein